MSVTCAKTIGNFPALGCLIDKDLNNSISKKETFLGGRRSPFVNRKTNVTLLLKTNYEMELFADWWVNDLDHGISPFKISLPFMSSAREYIVVMTNDLVENISDGEIREIKLELLLQT